MDSPCRPCGRPGGRSSVDVTASIRRYRSTSDSLDRRWHELARNRRPGHRLSPELMPVRGSRRDQRPTGRAAAGAVGVTSRCRRPTTLRTGALKRLRPGPLQRAKPMRGAVAPPVAHRRLAERRPSPAARVRPGKAARSWGAAPWLALIGVFLCAVTPSASSSLPAVSPFTSLRLVPHTP